MAKEKLSPRQKMINLMYLVFIAMLAMQIDQEIIRSYQDTNTSLEESRTLTEKQNDKIFEQTLKQKAENSPETYGKNYEDYQGLKNKVNDLVGFIERIKGSMRKEAGFVGNDVEANFGALNNTEIPSATFFDRGDEANPSKVAQELITKMNDIKQYLSQNFSNNSQLTELINRANSQMATEFPKGQLRNGKNWLAYKFNNQPLVAALANLEVIQSNARNIQSDAVTLMLQEKVDADMKFDAYEAIVAGPSVIVQGQPAEAKVFIGTYSNDPSITISGVDRSANGMGFKTLGASGVGEQTFSGTISYKNKNGQVVALPFKHNYNVIAGAQEVKLQSGALVSADKMNVLYRGVSNPISASMLGVDNSTVRLSAAGASVSGGNGKWNITPGGGSTVNITVTGTNPSGKAVSSTFPFRVKNVPAPQGQIRGSNVLSMPASSVPNQVVSAAIPDFDFPVSFQVTGFNFKAPGRATTFISGSSLAGVAGLTKGLRAGDVVYVFGIQATATGLGGQMLKNISPVVINIQ